MNDLLGPAIDFIKTVGFPAFVAVWYLLKTDKILNQNTVLLERICTALEMREHKDGQ